MKLIAILTAVLLAGCSALFLSANAATVKPTLPKPVGQHAPEMAELRDVDDMNVAETFAVMKSHFDHGDRHLYLRINSNGGSVFAGLDFIQNVEELKKQGARLTCIVDTRAISMGFVILQAVCDVRLATPRAFFLAHNGSLRTNGGTAYDMAEDVALLSVINDSMALICSEKIGMTLAEYKHKLNSQKSWTLGAEEAVRENVVDRLISPMETPKLDSGK